jgi:hypothetical protein
VEAERIPSADRGQILPASRKHPHRKAPRLTFAAAGATVAIAALAVAGVAIISAAAPASASPAFTGLAGEHAAGGPQQARYAGPAVHLADTTAQRTGTASAYPASGAAILGTSLSGTSLWAARWPIIGSRQAALARDQASAGQQASAGEPASMGQPASTGQPGSTGQQASAGEPASAGQQASTAKPASRGQRASTSRPARTGHRASRRQRVSSMKLAANAKHVQPARPVHHRGTARRAHPQAQRPGVCASSRLHWWICHAERVLEQHGTPRSRLNTGAAYIVVTHESGGNPRAYNGWDINAAQGHPSKGIAQVIGPTFQSYALPGHHNIWNPVDNMIAAFRYAISRYGSMNNIPGVVSVRQGGSYMGY